MNYRHAYHAGNFADVFKHALLIVLIEALKLKPKPLCYIDTHAGAGAYNLHADFSQKTGEYTEGVMRVLAQPRVPAPLEPYVELVRGLNPNASDHALDLYPGSPLIAAKLLRESDRLLLCEMQEEESAALRTTFASDARVAVHQRDGYAALNALLPPKERRGLILIDPPFEQQEHEFATIEAALARAFEKFATGVYAVWYPIKLRTHVAPFHRWLRGCGLEKILIAELLLHPDDSNLRLNGCGLAIVNTPWQVDKRIGDLLPLLQRHLAQGRFGGHKLEWLA